MKNRIASFAVVGLLIAIIVMFLEPTATLLGYVRGDQVFRGRSTTYWINCLTSASELTRSESLKELRRGGLEAAPVLIDILNRPIDASESPELRWAAVDLLTKVGPAARAATPALLRLINSKADLHTRLMAISAIGAIGPEAKGAGIVLAERLANAQERLFVLDTLCNLGPTGAEAVPAVKELLKDPVLEVRWMAAKTLGDIGPQASASTLALIGALSDSEYEVREHAAESLGMIQPPPELAVPALAKATLDVDQRVRRDAAKSLGMFGMEAKTAVAALQPLLKDPVEMVRDAAKKSLVQLQDGKK